MKSFQIQISFSKIKRGNRGLLTYIEYAQFDGMLLSPLGSNQYLGETYHKLYSLLPMVKSNEDTNKIE
jgi:hypothetical protein